MMNHERGIATMTTTARITEAMVMVVVVVVVVMQTSDQVFERK
jgi:hypothetical protein